MKNRIILPTKGMRLEGEKNRLTHQKVRLCGSRFSSSKGTVQVDYVFAVSAFILIFALIIQYTTSYYTKTNELTDIMLLRSDAMSILSITDCDEAYPCLQSHAYSFYILVNNTQENLINQSHSVSDLLDELVIFNLDDIYENPDPNSIVIYYNNTSVNYQRSGSEITFKTDINASQAQWFTVYFDDDSNFADRSTPVVGNDNLTEKVYPIEKIYMLQYRKLEQLKNSGYASSNLHLTIYNENNQTFFAYGSDVPKRGNVVALQKNLAYQDSIGNVEFGKFVVQVW